MDSLMHDATRFLAAHAAWAGLLLGLATFGEAILVVGAILPGTALLCLAGVLVALGILDWPTALIGATAGAVLGDATAFFIGQRLGPKTFHSPLLARHRRTVLKTRVLVRRHGMAIMFVGRFAGPLRAMVPLVAGMTRMPAPRFHLANMASSVVWVLGSAAPGYVAARGLAAIDGATWEALALAALIVVGIALLFGLARATKHRAARTRQPAPGVQLPQHTPAPLCC